MDFAGDTLTQFKVWGEAIINGTLNIAALLLAPMMVAGAQQRFRQSGLGSGYRRQQFHYHDADALTDYPVATVRSTLTFANIGSTGPGC